MKGRFWLIMVPLGLLLMLGLVVAGCGTSASSTTTTTASTTTTTTGAGGTVTTAPGGIAGVPSSIVVQLSGDQEVPAVKTSATGAFTLTISVGSGTGSSASTASTSGAGSALPAGLTLSYKLEVTNITDATAAHIHLGATGQNGAVVYPLFTGPQKSGNFTGVLAEGTLTEANLTGPYKGKTFADLVAAALQGQLYVNVHTVANPNGEIRGQLVVDMGAAGATSTTMGGTGGSTVTTAGATATTASGGY